MRFWLAALSFILVPLTAYSAEPKAWSGLDCEEILAQSGTSQVTEPLTMPVLRRDAALFVETLRACWSNRQTHERLNKVAFESKARSLLKVLENSNLSIDQALDALHLFSLSLRDGHLIFSDPRPSANLYSGLQTLQTSEGLAVVSCSSRASDCSRLILPAIITHVDEVPLTQWLEARASVSVGSTLAGRLYKAKLALEESFAPLKSEAGFATRPIRLGVLDRSGKKSTLQLEWTSDIPQAKSQAVSEPCVSSRNVNGAFILRVTGFTCLGNTDFGYALDAALIPLIKQELTRASRFDRIILDLRGNFGGLPGAAKYLVGRLNKSAKTFYLASQVVRSAHSINDEFAPRVDSTDAFDEDFRTKPLWILSDAGCFSQCSILVRSLIDAGRAKLIGEVDAGAGGPRAWRSQSGHFNAEIPVWRTLDRKHQPFEGVVIRQDRSIQVPLSRALDPDPVLTMTLEATRQ